MVSEYAATFELLNKIFVGPLAIQTCIIISNIDTKCILEKTEMPQFCGN